MATKFKASTKSLYDVSKVSEGNVENEALPELIVDNFDDEQIWQELELQNDPLVQQLVSKISKVSVHKDFSLIVNARRRKKETVESESTSDENKDESEGSERVAEDSDDNDDLDDLDIKLPSENKEKGIFDDEVDELESEDEQQLEKLLDKAMQEDVGSDEESENEEMEDEVVGDQFQEENNKDKITKMKSKRTGSAMRQKTVVDDKFFRLADMEAFLDQEDAKEERRHRKRKGRKNQESSSEEEEEIDYFADSPTPSDEDDDDQV